MKNDSNAFGHTYLYYWQSHCSPAPTARKHQKLHLSDTIHPKIDEDEDTEEGSLVFYFTEKALEGCTLYIPTGSLRKYRNTYGWRKFKKIVVE